MLKKHFRPNTAPLASFASRKSREAIPAPPRGKRLSCNLRGLKKFPFQWTDRARDRGLELQRSLLLFVFRCHHFHLQHDPALTLPDNAEPLM